MVKHVRPEAGGPDSWFTSYFYCSHIQAVYDHDPQPDVPPGRNPTAQCAFETLTFKASAIHAIYRSLLRSSSIHEPSDPPVRLICLSFC